MTSAVSSMPSLSSPLTQGHHANRIRHNTATGFRHTHAPNTARCRRPNLHAARLHPCVPLRPHTALPRRNSPCLLLNQMPAIQHPILHMCQLRPSYDHSTNSTLLRYKQLFSRYGECRNVECPPIWPRDTAHSRLPLHATTKSGNTLPPSKSPPMRPDRQLRPRYGHATNATLFRYEKIRFSYEQRRTLYLARDRAQLGFPPHSPQATLRNTYIFQLLSSFGLLQRTIPVSCPALRPWHTTERPFKIIEFVDRGTRWC